MIPVPLIIAGIAAGTLIIQKLNSKSKDLEKTIPANIQSKLAEPLHANAKTTEGKYLIEYALEKGDLNMLECLITNGANVNGHTQDGTPILIKAVLADNSQIVEKLLKRGANPNCMDDKGKTPLFYVSNDNFPMLQVLIQAGADVNARDAEGNYAIFHLLNENINKTVFSMRLKMLNEAGAKYNITDSSNRTLLFFAKTISHASTFLHDVDIDHKDSDGRTALFYIRGRGLTQYLIDNGADVNIQDNMGRTAIFYAESLEPDKNAYNIDSFDKVAALVENNARLDIKDHSGKTVIFYHHSPATLSYLLKQGADVNATDNEGKTLLFYTQNINLQLLLVNHGINMNAVDNDGNIANLQKAVLEASHDTTSIENADKQSLNMALDFAVTHNNIPMVANLLQQGANPNYKHKFVDDKCMLQIAIDNQNEQIVDLLLSCNANCNPKILNYAIKHESKAMVKHLINAGAEPDLESFALAIKHNLDDEIYELIKQHLC